MSRNGQSEVGGASSPGPFPVFNAAQWTTVKPLIVDPPRKGHNINDLSTRDTA